MYPNSVIFFCSPIQASAYIRDYRNIRDKGKYMDAICQVISDVNFIDTERCGISELFELNGANGRDLIDGLHPNVNGAKRLLNIISEKFLITSMFMIKFSKRSTC